VADPKTFARTNWISDACKLLSPIQANEINAICHRLFSKYGVEIAVVTVDTAPGGPMNLRPFFTELFNYWGLGDPTVNNGVLVAMIMTHRRIEMVRHTAALSIIGVVVCWVQCQE